MLRLKPFIFISFCLLLFGCNKEDICDCLKSTGEIETQVRAVADFDQIELNDNINLILTQDTINSVKIEAGKNLQDHIIVNLNNSVLGISNKNTFNWLRSYKKQINAYVHIKNLTNLTFRGSGDINSTDTIRSNIIYVENWDASGNVTLTIKARQSFLKEHIGTANFYINGISPYVYVWAAGYGIMDCRNLQADNVDVTNQGTNSCYVNASNSINAEIDYIGNVYYVGKPKTITTMIKNSGRLIQF